MKIKFRAWDKENKEMLKVERLWWEDGLQELVIQTTQYTDYFNTKEMILMPFTGLYDKNGKEIYEGDILLRKTNNNDKWASIVLVKYGKVEFSFLNKPYNKRNDKRTKWHRTTYQGLETYGEVIGNIYENSDLLGE